MTLSQVRPEQNALDQTHLDQTLLRQALAAMATPVVVVTATVDGARYGFTANSFTSVSMDPPLLGVYLATTSSQFEAFMAAQEVAVNVLAAGQGPIASQFATPGADKFAGVEVDPDHVTAPVLAGTLVSLIGPVAERTMLGDHVLILVTPRSVTTPGDDPLVYHQRRFHQLPGLPALPV